MLHAGTDRFRPAPNRPQLAWAGTSLGPVCDGPYRVSNGLCRSMLIRAVPVQASWGRSDAGLNRSVPRRDRKKRCNIKYYYLD